MTHPQNCKTCEYNDNHYCELYKCRVSFSEVSTLEQVGCASHSDAGKEREKVLNLLKKEMGEYSSYWLQQSGYETLVYLEEQLRQGGE